MYNPHREVIKFPSEVIQSEVPLVSIIILNYNGKEFLEDCLGSVLMTDYPSLEVIFVDNGSTDGSVNFVTRRFGENSRLIIVENHKNLGFDEGNNVGAKYAKGDLLVFLNNDTTVEPNWLRELVKTSISDDDLGIAISRIICQSSPEGLLIGNIDKYGNGVLIPLNDAENIEIIASGPAFLIKRYVWNKVGGFDSKFFAYADDIDLAWRVKLLGYKIKVSLNSVVYHKVGGATGRLGLARRRYLTYRNTQRTLLKNYSASTLLRTIPISLLLTFIQSIALTYLVKCPDILLSPVKALLWNMINLKDTLALHKHVQRSRVISDSEIQRLMVESNPFVTYSRRNI